MRFSASCAPDCGYAGITSVGGGGGAMTFFCEVSGTSSFKGRPKIAWCCVGLVLNPFILLQTLPQLELSSSGSGWAMEGKDFSMLDRNECDSCDNTETHPTCVALSVGRF